MIDQLVTPRVTCRIISLSLSAQVSGNLETKYKFKEHGITVTEKWNTDNNISATIDVQVREKFISSDQ